MGSIMKNLKKYRKGHLDLYRVTASSDIPTYMYNSPQAQPAGSRVQPVRFNLSQQAHSNGYLKYWMLTFLN